MPSVIKNGSGQFISMGETNAFMEKECDLLVARFNLYGIGNSFC